MYLPSEVRLSWLASVMTAPPFEVMDGRCCNHRVPPSHLLPAASVKRLMLGAA